MFVHQFLADDLWFKSRFSAKVRTLFIRHENRVEHQNESERPLRSARLVSVLVFNSITHAAKTFEYIIEGYGGCDACGNSRGDRAYFQS